MKFDVCTTLPDWPELRSHIFGQISKAFTREPHLLPVSEIELVGSFVQGLSMIVRYERQPVAHTRLFKITDKDSPSGEWYELGSTWVHPDYSGHQLCTHMYQKFLPSHEGKNILATTTNQAMIAVGHKMGFIMIPRKSLPHDVWKASCTCLPKKTGVVENSFCLLAHGEKQQCGGPCWFRVTKSTAERLGVLRA